MRDPQLPNALLNSPNNWLTRLENLELRMDELEAGETPQYEEIVGGRLTIADLILSPAEGVLVADPTSTEYTGSFMAGEGIEFDGVFYVLGNVINGELKTGFTDAGTLFATEAEISGTITASAGNIGGWIIDSTSIYKLSSDIGIVLDSSGPVIRVGDTSNIHIVIDGDAERIHSSNFVAGSAGFNIDASTGDAEFNNLIARGMIRTAVFEKEVISSIGGSLLVLDSDVLDADMSALDSATLTIQGNTTFAVGDILRMKDGVSDEWFEVTNVGSAPTYTVTRDMAGVYTSNNNPTWTKGQAVVNYGQSGDGGILLESGDTPLMKIFTHDGQPWSDITNHIILGEGMMETSADRITIDWWLPFGLSGDIITSVRAYAYDGSEFLYVGGGFSVIGGIPANNVARYSLITREWEALGSGCNGLVYAIAISGINIYVGGAFASAGGVANTDGIARWDGAAWNAMGTGTSGGTGTVRALAVSGSDVFAGGEFTQMGGVANTPHIARWNGSAWNAMGTGVSTGAGVSVFGIEIDGSGNVFIGGEFSQVGGISNTAYIAKWNGSAWSSVGIFNARVLCFKYDANSGYLYAGGRFSTITGVTGTLYIAKYDGATWTAVGGGLATGVFAIDVDADGFVYAGGEFTNIGGDPLADRIVYFDGTDWLPLTNSGGVAGLDGVVYAIYWQSGTASVYVGGSFDTAGSLQVPACAVYVRLLSEVIDQVASLLELYENNSNGSYTPTVTAVTNLDSVGSAVAHYTRVGRHVTVWGRITNVNPTTANIGTVLSISPPFPIAATGWADEGQCNGSIGRRGNSGTTPYQAGAIYCSTGGTNALASFTPPHTDARDYSFHFSYVIIP